MFEVQATMVVTWLTELYLDQINRAMLDVCQDEAVADPGDSGTADMDDASPRATDAPAVTPLKNKRPAVAHLETKLLVRCPCWQ